MGYITPQGLSDAVKKVARIEMVSDHQPSGWYALNSIVPTECRPTFRNVGGGVGASDLTDLPRALDKSIAHVETSIRTATAHLEKLRKARATLETESAP